MYRETTITTGLFDDVNQTRAYYGPSTLAVTQTLDKEGFSKLVRVGASDAEAAVDITPLTTAYYIELRSDYPVLVRINGSSATQFTLIGQNTTVKNVGAPVPDKCFFAATMTVTSVRLAPITAASTTANVTLILSGDPTSAYTGG